MTNEQPSAVRSRDDTARIADDFYPREMFVGRFPGNSIEYSQEDDFDPDSLVEDSVRYVRVDLAVTEALRAENERFREMLRAICLHDGAGFIPAEGLANCIRIARDALASAPAQGGEA